MKKSVRFGLWITIFVMMVSLLLAGSLHSSPSSTPVSGGAALSRLLVGNERFSIGASLHQNISQERVNMIKSKQTPIAIIVSCSDSRVPPEIIFDQGLGDIFVVRTAGNVIGQYELGSIEYAVEHLNVKLIMVLGHGNCGAVTAYMHSDGHSEGNAIDSIMNSIRNNSCVQNLSRNDRNVLSQVINANIMGNVELLKNTQMLQNYTKNQGLIIVGALYDMNDGKVMILKK